MPQQAIWHIADPLTLSPRTCAMMSLTVHRQRLISVSARQDYRRLIWRWCQWVP